MAIRYLFFTIVCLALKITPACAINYHYTYSPQCHKAYTHYMSLQFAEGNAAIRAELKTDSGNLMAVYISNYADCMLLLFNGDKRDYEKLSYHLQQRQSLLDRGNGQSPWQKLCKAGIYMQWAFIHIRMGENLKAAANFRKSYILLKENSKRFPSFEYNDIFFGLEQAVVGTVPDDYRWIASIFGLRGDVKKGIEKISRFVAKHNASSPLYYDAILYNSYLRFYLLSQQEQVWDEINSPIFPAANNLLFSFVRANIAINYRKADEALATLQQMQQMRGYKYIPAFEYEVGSALIYKSDTAAAGHLRTFINTYKGRIFVKDALLKLAYIQYLGGNMQQAKYYRDMIKKYGTTDVDADRRAARFAEGTVWPHPVLLRSTLLIDGGYYAAALQLLMKYKEGDFATMADKAEYNLRAGRASDEAGNKEKALKYYARCIMIGRQAKEYFAARAALQTGFIYENKGQIQQAIDAYRECLDMPVQDYKNAIKQQAKAGINRLSTE